MNMNMKKSKKMMGFMCYSPSSTAVCMSQDLRSAILPIKQKLDRSLSNQVRLINNTKYARLHDEHRAFPVSMTVRKSFNVSSLKEDSEKKTQDALALSDHVFQVVVLKVSIHCQGCAGKVKKHLSKMEGVTSFSIDLESKKVTVMGHVSPSNLLESISKVKKAELWAC